MKSLHLCYTVSGVSGYYTDVRRLLRVGIRKVRGLPPALASASCLVRHHIIRHPINTKDTMIINTTTLKSPIVVNTTGALLLLLPTPSVTPLPSSPFDFSTWVLLIFSFICVMICFEGFGQSTGFAGLLLPSRPTDASAADLLVQGLL